MSEDNDSGRKRSQYYVDGALLIDLWDYTALTMLEGPYLKAHSEIRAKKEGVALWQLHLSLISRIAIAAKNAGDAKLYDHWCDRLGAVVAEALKLERTRKTKQVLEFAKTAWSNALSGIAIKSSKKHVERYDLVHKAYTKSKVRNHMIARRLAWQALPEPRPPIREVKPDSKFVIPSLETLSKITGLEYKVVKEIVREMKPLLLVRDGRELAKKRPRKKVSGDSER